MNILNQMLSQVGFPQMLCNILVVSFALYFSVHISLWWSMLEAINTGYLQEEVYKQFGNAVAFVNMY